MKLQDMGMNPETGEHSQAFTEAEATMMGILADHIGKDEKISANDLALFFREAMEDRRMLQDEWRKGLSMWKRDVRYVVNHLIIAHDQPIMSKAGNHGGYWLAETQQEVNEFYETFRKRAMTGMTKAARGKQAVLADMVKQLTFEFEELKTAQRPGIVPVRPLAPEPAPVTVITAFLEKMTREPEKFSHEITLLRRKFGQVLMPKEMFEDMRQLSAKLSELIGKVG